MSTLQRKEHVVVTMYGCVCMYASESAHARTREGAFLRAVGLRTFALNFLRVVGMRFFLAGLLLLAGCAGSTKPDTVTLRGDTAVVLVQGTIQYQEGTILSASYEDPGAVTRAWLQENGYEHWATIIDTTALPDISPMTFNTESGSAPIVGRSKWIRVLN